MKKLLLLTKTLLAAALLCVGQNAWGDAVASHDFNSSTTPFIIHDGARIGVTYEEHVADGGDYYAKYSCTRSSGKAFAYCNFSSSVADAASVAVEFDCYFKSGSWQSFISLADANYHTADVLGIGNVNYNKTGAIFNLGQNRAKVSGTNEDHFGINSAHVSALDETCLEKWIHVSITVDNASRKVSYTIKNADQTSTLKSETNINFLDATAQRCSQVDIYLGNNTSNFVYIDNLVITKTVSDVSHNYTINAVSGGSTIKTNIKSGEAKEGATYTVSGLPYVVEKDGKFYVLDDANVINYGVTFTMLNADQTKTVNYTLDESIVYFKEAEAITGSQNVSSASCSGGVYVNYYAGPTSVTIPVAGVYELETNVASRNSKSSLEVYTADGTTSVAAIAKGGSLGVRTCQFSADAGTMRVGGPYYNDKFQNSLGFDYVLVRLKSVPATITSAGYATFSSTYALDFSELSGLTAYIATSGDASTVTIEPVEDAAAGTGLVLKGVAGTYNIPVVASGTDHSGSNKLWAITEDGNVTAAGTGYTNYVLALQEGSVVFAPVTGENSASVKAGQAALCLPDAGGARALSISFGDITAVENVEAAPSEVKAKEGKFIENGKLVIVKNGVKYNAAGAQVK